MNFPNKLTVARILITPVFLATLIIDFSHNYLVALVMFVLASITDYIDGKLAREKGQITNFGKFLDPLADKMLTTAAFLGFIKLSLGYGIVWITLIVLLREFLITSLRLISAGHGKIVAANIWGKIKTVVQMIAIIFTLSAEYVISLEIIGDEISNIIRYCETGALWISASLTIISGVVYVLDNYKYIDPKK